MVFWYHSFLKRKAYKKSRRRLKRGFIKENNSGNNYVNHKKINDRRGLSEVLCGIGVLTRYRKFKVQHSRYNVILN